MRLLEAIVDLRLASRRGLIRDRAKAEKAVRAEWKVALASARERGVLETLPAARGDGLAAAFVARPHPSPLVGGLKLDLLLRDRRATPWIRERLAAHRRLFTDEVAAHVTLRDEHLVPDLERAGMHLDSIQLAGDPRRALHRLRRRYGEPGWTSVECRPLESLRQVRAVVALTRAEFTRNPRFGAFASRPRFVRSFTAALRADLDRAIGNQWVLVRGSDVVGHFGFNHFAQSALGCSVAAFGVTLDRSLQGAGLAKIAYRTMLERMVELDVGLVVGITAQPPVMHMSAVMGRRLIGYEMSTGRAWFPREHFQYPPAPR